MPAWRVIGVTIARLEKYFSMVCRLGGGVSSEKMIMHSAEPNTMGTTVI